MAKALTNRYPYVSHLANGKAVQLSPIGATDRGDLLAGFAELSKHSRRLRFFSSMSEIPPFVLSRLLDTDGHNHVALGAREIDSKQVVLPEIVGIVRYYRSQEDPSAAEMAVTVIDRLHHQGLGSLLVQHLVDWAHENDISHFTAHTLAENTPMRNMIVRSGGKIRSRDRDGLVYDIPLKPVAYDDRLDVLRTATG